MDVPFREDDRLLVKVRDKDIVIERIDYYVAKPTVKKGNYFRINIPRELATKLWLYKYDLLKVYEREGKIIIEPLK